MPEYGIFSEDGLVEGGFTTMDDAWWSIEHQYSAEDDLTVDEICPDHPEQAKWCCEECHADDKE